MVPPDPPCDPDGAGRDRPSARRRGRGDDPDRRRHRLDRDHVRVSRPRCARLDAAAAARDPDLHRGLCLRRSAGRARSRPVGATRAVRLALGGRILVPQCPLARRRDPAVRLRALSLRLSRRPRDAADAGYAARRAGPHAGRAPVGDRAAHQPAIGATGHRRGAVACLARDPQRHRRERISRRADADAVDLHHLAQPRKPRRRRADLLPAAPDRGRADLSRTTRPQPPEFRGGGAGGASLIADQAHRPVAMGRRRRLPGPRAPGLPAAGRLSRARGHRTGATGRFRPCPPPLCPDHGRTRRRRDDHHADAGVPCGGGAAHLRPSADRRERRHRRHRLRGAGHRAGARPALAARAHRRRHQRTSAQLRLQGCRPCPGGLGSRARPRLCDPFPRDRSRIRTGRLRPHSARARRGRAPAWRRAGPACPHHPLAAGTAGHFGGCLARVRGLPQGTAGHPAAAAAQRRDARDPYLPVRDPRQLRARRRRRPAHRGGGYPARDPDHPLCGRDDATPRGVTTEQRLRQLPQRGRKIARPTG